MKVSEDRAIAIVELHTWC